MKQMLVRNIADEVAARFKRRARAEGKSAEQALRDLIAEYARPAREQVLRRFDAIRERTIGKPIVDPVAVIREDRDSNHGRL